MANLILPAETDYTLALREPNLLVPGQKPVNPVEIDWSHPFAKGLLYCAIAVPEGFLDLVSGKIIPPRIPANGEFICGGWQNIGTNQVDFDFIGKDFDATEAISVAFHGEVLSCSSNYTHLLGQTFSPTAYFAASDTTGYGSSVTSGQRRSGLRISSGYFNDVSSVSKGPVYFAGSISSLNYWPNYKVSWFLKAGGVRDERISTPSADMWSYNFNRYVIIGQNTKTATARMYFVASWDRPFQPNEVQSIQDNPYQLLKPANSTPYPIRVPTSGATVTLSNPFAAATGQTTWSGSCDVTYV